MDKPMRESATVQPDIGRVDAVRASDVNAEKGLLP